MSTIAASGRKGAGPRHERGDVRRGVLNVSFDSSESKSSGKRAISNSVLNTGGARHGAARAHAMSRWAATRLPLTNYLALEMPVATKKPLPSALKALQPILDTLPLEEDPEGKTGAASIRDFTVRVVFVWRAGKS